MATTPRRPQTIGEARPNVPRAWILTVTTVMVLWFFAYGHVTMRMLLSFDPLRLARVPWLLPLWLLWSVYLSLAFVVRSYAHLYLPRTPVAVDEAFVDVGIVGIGSVALNVMEVVVVIGLPVEDPWLAMSCTGVVAACVVGLLAFWAWLVRTYGGPEPTDDAKAGRSSWEGWEPYRNL